MERILIADDDSEFTELLTDYLGQQGFVADAVANGLLALQRLAAEPEKYQALVLDIMMPKLGGLETLGELRGAPHAAAAIPVVMLTARGDDVDRIVGLELGADDYLPKPANPRELVARLRAVLRRSSALGAPAGEPPKVIEQGDLRIDIGRREARLNGHLLALTDSELLLLIELTKNAGSIVTKDKLALATTGRPLGPYDRSIDMHLSNLRRKLEQRTAAADGLSSPKQRIKTVRNRGYQYLV